MKNVNFHELSKPSLSCANRRKGIVTEAAKKDMVAFQKSTPLYAIIDEMLALDKLQLKSWYATKVNEGFKTVAFPTEETRKKHVSEMAYLLYRYHQYLIRMKNKLEMDLPKLAFTPLPDVTISGVNPNYIYCSRRSDQSN